MEFIPADCELTPWPPKPEHGMLTGSIYLGFRVVHKPTGCAVECTHHRHPYQNKQAAIQALCLMVEYKS